MSPTPRPEPMTAARVLNNASEAAAHGRGVLPPDVTVRRQYEDLLALAGELLPRVTTPEKLLEAADDLHWRATRLAAMATLPGVPSFAEQEQMFDRDRLAAAARSVAAARQAGTPVTLDLLTAAYDMSDDLAARVLRGTGPGC
ncbi:hypothetical protein F5972_08695 [Microbispora cellulosiformans]|uniref:Uncharacterized protein n=1 Tax=Microbispora cellulosiformans TaxID=2614688 RepID=A0A5J5K8C8_9ACTN|nr:hypothetical protein [Microbispora cellulosiformans]KAA9379719.1 hypothetical protein F5972_08695 [Microbispora cellulosiformans]